MPQQPDAAALLASNPYYREPGRAAPMKGDPGTIQEYWTRVNNRQAPTYQEYADVVPQNMQHLVPPSWGDRYQHWSQTTGSKPTQTPTPPAPAGGTPPPAAPRQERKSEPSSPAPQMDYSSATTQ